MGHKKKHSGTVPPGNQSKMGPGAKSGRRDDKTDQTAAEVTSAQEQDPKHRMGDFSGKADHSIQEPGGHNDANH